MRAHNIKSRNTGIKEVIDFININIDILKNIYKNIEIEFTREKIEGENNISIFQKEDFAQKMSN